MENSTATGRASSFYAVFYAVEDGGYWEVWETIEEAEKDAALCIADENYSGHCYIHTIADALEPAERFGGTILDTTSVDQPDTDVNRRPIVTK